MQVVCVNTESETGTWDRFVGSVPSAGYYHQYAWREVFSQSYGHVCHYLAAVSSSGEWRGILPLVHVKSRIFGNDLVSLPFVNQGGLVCKDDAAAAALLEAAEKLRRSCSAARVELRHCLQTWDSLPTSQHKVTMILDLAADEQLQWTQFNSKLRNQIRKAEKSGLTTAQGHLDLLDGFYDVVARNMRDLGSPVHSKEFFRNVLGNFPDSTKILAVFLGDKMIAAGLVCWFKGLIEIPWASSIRDYNSLCPNNLLYWTAIRFAIARDIRQFDFGRSTPNEGTYNFKLQWGAKPVPLKWQYLRAGNDAAVDRGNAGRKYQFAIAVWQRLPISLTKTIGPSIRKNISL